MKRKKTRLITISIFIILIIILLALGITFIYYLYQIPITTEGFIPMQVDRLITVADTSVVQLKGECSEISIYISPWQASAISEGTFNTTPFRPSTHDITVDILEGYDIMHIMVKVTRLEENTYFAELVLQRWNHILILDIRPSDAIAVAVRTNTPIFVNETLVTKTC